jgi:hypothetical protein
MSGCEAALPAPKRGILQHQVHSGRDWRFDLIVCRYFARSIEDDHFNELSRK